MIGYSTSGYVRLCINNEPIIYGSDCPNKSRESVNFTCSLNAIDPDGKNLTYTALSLNRESMPYTVLDNGTYTFSTYSGNTSNYSNFIGQHELYLIVSDESGCTNHGASFYINFEVYDKNDPPILVQPIPDMTIPTDTTVTMFNLDDYFSDPEQQVLTYNNIN